MSQTQLDPVYRTTPERTIKMMAIMLGISIAGGAIFFGMWDYWISELSQAAIIRGEMLAAANIAGTTVALEIAESSNLQSLGFNALPGSIDANPTVTTAVGSTLIFEVTNSGTSFYSFGVTEESSGIGGVISGTEIISTRQPLAPGESGTSVFTPESEGTYYYISTIAGQRDLGLSGMILVGPEGEAPPPPAVIQPTGISHEFSLTFTESADLLTLGFNAVRGEEGANPDLVVGAGDKITVTVANIGRSFHSFGVTANPEDFSNTLWNSEIASPLSPLLPGESGEVTFTAGAPGTYYYICTVAGHSVQGMQGIFIVE